MISAGDFKNGLTLEIDGQVMQIVEFQHVKPGKGAAFVRTKMRNVINGGVVEKTFRPTEKFPAARIDRKDQQYLYNDGDLFYFMDPETYDQKTKWLRYAHTMAKYSPLSRLFSLNLRLLIQSPDLPEIQHRVRRNRQQSRPAQQFRFRSSSTSVML